MKNAEEKPLLTLSKENGDFIVQPFKGSGKGGQKRNKTMSACRIIHPASGARAECQEERSFDQNRKKAFQRLVERPEFKQWLDIETRRRMGQLASAEEWADKELATNVKTEVQVNGKWVDEIEI